MPIAKTASKRKITPSKEESMPELTTASTPKQSFLSKLAKMNWTPVLVILLIIAAFFLGMLVTKVQYLTSDKAPTANNQQAGTQQPSAPVKPLHVAKSIGIDEKKFAQCLDTNKYTQKVSDDNAYAQKVGVQATPATYINGNLVLGAVPYDTLKQAIDQEIQNPNAPLPSGTRADVANGDFPIMGDANAPVTIIEFADFQCPFCERYYSQVLPNLINDYVKTGKAKFAFRNYAFLGPDSTAAAEGAYCAQEQGKFWDYYNYIYSHQGAEGSGQLSKTNLK